MKADFPPQEAIEVWDPVNRQDWEICKRVQRGVQARVHEFGYHADLSGCLTASGGLAERQSLAVIQFPMTAFISRRFYWIVVAHFSG